MKTQVQRLREMLAGEHNVGFYNNGRENATLAVDSLLNDAAGKLAMLTLLDEIEHEDAVEHLDKAGM